MTAKFWVVMAVFIGISVVMLTAALHFSGKFGVAHGIVVDARTGEAVADADVELFAVFAAEHGGSKMTLMKTQKTGADGAFKFPATVGGTYRMTVSREGYLPLVMESVDIEQQAQKDFGRLQISRAPSASAPAK